MMTDKEKIKNMPAINMPANPTALQSSFLI